MTLKSRLLFANCVIFATLLTAAAVSLWVVWVMAANLNWVSGEYRELRLLDHASNDLAAVDGLLRSDRLDFDLIDQKMQSAVNGLSSYAQLQIGDEQAPTEYAVEHELVEKERSRKITEALKPVAELTETFHRQMVNPDPGGLLVIINANKTLEAVERVRTDVESLARQADSVVTEAHARSRLALWRAVLMLLGVNLLAVAVVILSGSLQYRAVVPPLATMRDRVREIASGKLDLRLGYRGKDEFGDLAADFNRMIAELESLYQNLEERVRDKSRQLVRSERLASAGYLAAGVAHEINNPLSIIAGHAELALKDLRNGSKAAADPETVHGLEIIHDEAFRCKRIIEKLLSLVRNPQHPRSEVSLNRVTQDVAEMVRGLKQFAGKIVEMDFPEGKDLKVSGHESEIKQVLLNLIVNAMEAAPDQGGRVRIRGRADNGEVELCVIDNGAGMTPDMITHVFEPFYTRKRGTGEPGNGLGLSIVHAIVREHGGRIEAFSDGPGQGSWFTINLPNAERAPHGAHHA